jgi:hypothetical protein
MKKWKRHRLAAVEHCKEYVREAIQAMMDGSQGATQGVVVTGIWRELDKALGDAMMDDLCGTAHYRVEVEDSRERVEGLRPSAGMLAPDVDGTLLSVRCVSARREKGLDVYYFVVEAGNYNEACRIREGFLKRDCKVTDWQYFA